MASKIAVTHPERVAKLVIVASGATSPLLGDERDEASRQASQEAYDWELEASSEDAYVRNFTRSMYYFPDRMDENLLRANYRDAQHSGNLSLYLNLPPDVSEEARYYAVAREHVHPYLPQLSMECLLLWANNDPTVPVERGLALMEMIPHAEMHILNQAKHMVMVDAADGFNRALCGLC